MEELTLEEKAKRWFKDNESVNVDKLISDGIISVERIVEYYLRRHPWKKENKND